MPSVKFNLASQRLQASGTGAGRLSASGLSGSVGGSLRAPTVNINAANVRYAPAPIPPVVIDTSLDSAAQASKVMVDSAFRFQQMEAQAQADSAILSAQQEYEKAAIAYGEENGKSAQDMYGSFTGQIDNITESALDNLNESARAKAVNRLAKAKHDVTLAGAKHKSQQFQVWQGEILIAEENKVINDITTTGTDTKLTAANMQGQMDRIAARYPGQNEKIAIEQQKFNEKMYGNLISTYTDLGSKDPKKYNLAAFYVAEAGKAGVNPAKLAQASKSIDTAIIRDTNRAITLENRRSQVEKRQIEQQTNQIINMVASDPTKIGLLDSIGDPSARAGAYRVLSALNNGIASTDTGLLAMNSKRAEFAMNPQAVLSATFPGVNSKDQLDFYKTMIADRAKGLTGLKDQYENWTDTVLPPSRVGGPASAAHKEAVDATRQRINTMFSDAINDAVKNETSTQQAIYNVQKEIMTDELFTDNYSAVKVNRQMLGSVGQDLLGLETALDSISDEYARYDRVELEYEKSAESLLSQYGVTSYATLVQDLAGDPQAQRELNRAASMIMLQRRYYLDLAAKGSKNNASSDSDYGL